MLDIHATGFIGLAFETTPGTFVPATKFFPIRSEELMYNQDNQDRRVIQGVADNLGVIAGNVHIEGDIEMEALHDVLPYWLYASRNTVVKTGAGPYTYTTTPTHGAVPPSGKTLSITVVKAGVAHGFSGCVVGSIKLGVDSGVLVNTVSIVGRDEGDKTVPVPTFANAEPFGAGTYTISNPTATPVYDVETFELEIEDNATPEFRLALTRGARFVRFGEREVSLSMTRDYTDRTEFDTWKALTKRSVTVKAESGANSISAKVPGTIKREYNINGLSSQGDLVKAEITYGGNYDAATSKSYELVVVTSENITQ